MTEDEYIHVVIDAEVLRRDAARTRGAFRALGHLATAANVRIHVPEVARQEFLTAQEQSIDDEFREAISALKQARSRLRRDHHEVLDNAIEQLKSAKGEAKRRVRNSFSSWIETNHVVIDPISSHHGSRVMEAYFQGAPPFRAAKHRDDIPDAFIYQSINDIATDGRDLVFITGDSRLRRSLDGLVGTLYSTIEEFIERENITQYLRRGIVESQLTAAFDTLLEQLFETEAVHQRVASELLGRKVWIYFPVDIVATVAEVVEVAVLWVDNKVAYYGKGLLGLPISTRVRCQLRAELPPGYDQTIALQRDVSLMGAEGGSASMQVERTHVVTGTILIALPEDILERETKLPPIQQAVAQCEWVLDDIRVQDDVEREAPAFDELMKHALDEAERQLSAGDLDATVDPAEEAALAARARWVDIPERFHGTHGKITIGPHTRVKLRPPGRFEVLVKSAKQTLLKMQDGGETDGG